MDLRAQLVRDHVREARLPQAGRAAEEDVIERLTARAGGLDEHLQVVEQRGLADHLVEASRPQRAVEARVVPLLLRLDFPLPLRFLHRGLRYHSVLRTRCRPRGRFVSTRNPSDSSHGTVPVKAPALLAGGRTG